MFSLKEFILNQWKERGIIRIGKCLNCGKCCEGGVKIYSCKESTVEMTERKEKQCIHYDEFLKKCNNYRNRVCWCTLFPYLPEVMFEGCGYKFVKIEELLERNTKQEN